MPIYTISFFIFPTVPLKYEHVDPVGFYAVVCYTHSLL